MSTSSPSCNSTWGFVEWAITGLVTLVASVGAFVWRLTLRLEAIDASLTRARQDLGETRQASEAAAQRLADRFDQLHEESSRLRESVGALPTRDDLRSLDARIAERLEALAARLDRALDA
jgi:hypothetical protein